MKKSWKEAWWKKDLTSHNVDSEIDTILEECQIDMIHENSGSAILDDNELEIFWWNRTTSDRKVYETWDNFTWTPFQRSNSWFSWLPPAQHDKWNVNDYNWIECWI